VVLRVSSKAESVGAGWVAGGVGEAREFFKTFFVERVEVELEVLDVDVGHFLLEFGPEQGRQVGGRGEVVASYVLVEDLVARVDPGVGVADHPVEELDGLVHALCDQAACEPPVGVALLLRVTVRDVGHGVRQGGGVLGVLHLSDHAVGDSAPPVATLVVAPFSREYVREFASGVVLKAVGDVIEAPPAHGILAVSVGKVGEPKHLGVVGEYGHKLVRGAGGKRSVVLFEFTERLMHACG
jgi:hypothetical protein